MNSLQSRLQRYEKYLEYANFGERKGKKNSFFIENGITFLTMDDV